ncbi:MAG: cyclase [SAR116 cluster bacterium]|nr:cyclase [SAR116 cluster bacterium]
MSGDNAKDQPDAATLLAGLAAGLASAEIRIVDLTHRLDPDFPIIVLPPEFGQCAPFRMEEISRYDARGPAWHWYNISLGEHAGTHFDAPIHWISGRDLPNNTTDTLPVQKLVGQVCVIDCEAESDADDDYEMGVDKIAAFEAEHGEIPAQSWVLMRTGWSRRRGADYINLRADGAHSPGPDAAAVRFLVEQRDIIGFGTETVGTDTGQAVHADPPYPAHYILHGAGRYGLQCLANLDQLPPTGAVLVAAPLKIRQGTGSPLRVLALVP